MKTLKKIYSFLYDRDLDLLLVSVIFISVSIVGGYLALNHKDARKAARERTCLPYAMLGYYAVDKVEYVVCGNEEIREVPQENP